MVQLNFIILTKNICPKERVKQLKITKLEQDNNRTQRKGIFLQSLLMRNKIMFPY